MSLVDGGGEVEQRGSIYKKSITSQVTTELWKAGSILFLCPILQFCRSVASGVIKLFSPCILQSLLLSHWWLCEANTFDNPDGDVSFLWPAVDQCDHTLKRHTLEIHWEHCTGWFLGNASAQLFVFHWWRKWSKSRGDSHGSVCNLSRDDSAPCQTQGFWTDGPSAQGQSRSFGPSLVPSCQAVAACSHLTSVREPTTRWVCPCKTEGEPHCCEMWKHLSLWFWELGALQTFSTTCCKTEPLHQHNRIMMQQWGVNNADVVKKGFYKYFMRPEMALNMFVRPSGYTQYVFFPNAEYKQKHLGLQWKLHRVPLNLLPLQSQSLNILRLHFLMKQQMLSSNLKAC